MLYVKDRIEEISDIRFQQIHDLAKTNTPFLHRQICMIIIMIISLAKLMRYCSDIGIDDEDEFTTKFIYGNNVSTDNITDGVAA